jgi:hypothetical protein
MSLSELPLQANASLFHSIIEEEQSEGGWRPGWEPALRHRPESRSLDFHILANSKSHFLHNVSVSRWQSGNEALDGFYNYLYIFKFI